MKLHDEKLNPKTNHNKKEYRSPRLLVYGDVREITQTVGNSGNFDNGGPLKTGA